MKVIVWSTPMPPNASTGKELVEAIKSNGQEIDHIGLQDILVNGQYFIMGGRKSISQALGGSPGAFKCAGGNLAGRMARLSTGALSKTYTVIKISNQTAGAFDAKGWAQLHLRGKFDTPGGNLFVGARGTTKFTVGGPKVDTIVPFSDVVQAMWEADSRSMGKMVGI